MDGGKRGQVVKVCADPACRTHHPNTPSPQQVERERAEERKRIEKEKLAITTRHRVLATILQRVSAPLKKADLLAVAHYLIGHLSYSQVPALAKRHKVEAKKDSASAQELLAKQVGTYDEAELCKLLLEISLLDSAYQRSTASRDDVRRKRSRQVDQNENSIPSIRKPRRSSFSRRNCFENSSAADRVRMIHCFSTQASPFPNFSVMSPLMKYERVYCRVLAILE